MASRATGFAKRTPAASRANTAPAPGDEEPREIALYLAPMLAPYRRRERVSIRVERLPHRARLSSGRNNGDRSWSLLPDELEGLTYQPPPGMYEAHTLAIRVISLEGGGGGTLAVIDYPIPGTEPPPVEEAASAPEPATPAASPAPTSDKSHGAGEVRRLQDELTRLQTALAARDSELEVAKAESELSQQSRQRVEAELSATRATHEKELRDRLAAASADATRNLEQARQAWEAESKKAPAVQTQLPNVEQIVAQARDRWQRDADGALAKAQAAWKAEEAAKLAAAEARWREKSGASSGEAKTRLDHAEAELAKLRAEAESLRSNTSATEMRRASENAEGVRLRGELTMAQAALARRDAELANAREEADKLRARVSEAEARRASENSDVTKLRAELVAANDALTRRDAELAEARTAADRAWSAMEDAREVWAREADATLARTQAEWKASETVRMSQAEAEWRDQAARQVSEANARAGKAEAEALQARAEATALRSVGDVEQSRMRDTTAALQAKLTEREAELSELRADLVKARVGIEEARGEARLELQSAMLKVQDFQNALEEWKAEEAPRLAAAEAQGRESGAKANAELRNQLKESEKALTQLRTQASGKRNEDAEVFRLREHVAALEASIADRDIELMQVRAESEQRRDLLVAESNNRRFNPEDEEDDRNRKIGRLVRDVAIVGALAATAIILYPRVEPVVVEGWLPKLEALATGREVSFADSGTGAVTAAPPPAAAAQSPQSFAVSLKSANVRSEPSASSSVIMTLPRGTQVGTLERHGNWVHVRIAIEGSKVPQDGWVFGTFLQDLPGSASPGPSH